ncbi:hypothetical protein QEH59_09240 [Coraliomargarita sp. SDUM461004]|uniref:Uncharacterized protein n=1 Tax=Thalassobacterium sedimentorum TaxID=3041258 RepID=A0ABU1AIP3_9BACT|nr:hypothetical protein [Coraliomargarita sp. SDUM461004]MDQ8194609.1 hypothetical protein [Coraliomargarita sp. SDUM461004]
MASSHSKLSIGFESEVGSFYVESDNQLENIFNLSFRTGNREPLLLGQYCSITDAVAAVVQQQTGCSEWDQLAPQELPRRVHNIANWKFSQNLGTIPQVACS